MKEQKYTTGEVAKLSGLTIRTLQHYDNIGVLPASGRTENGRRFYTENDLMKLEHILFYRGLGFPLEQIKEQLINFETTENISGMLAKQSILLQNKISCMQNSIAAIEACQEIVAAGKTPPWTLLTTFLQSLEKVDISYWENYEFSESQAVTFQEIFQSFDDIMEFYNTWKRLSIKAAAFYQAEIQPTEEIAQKLAKNWVEMTQKVTGGNEEYEQAFLDVDRDRSQWNPAERTLIEMAEPFLQEAISIYQQMNM